MDLKWSIGSARSGVMGILLMFYAGCATPPGTGARRVEFGTQIGRRSVATNQTKTRAELEDEILRFEGHFRALMNDAFRPLAQSESVRIRRAALQRKLAYLGAALDIAVGMIPEQNLFDMIVFVELARRVFRDHWIPTIFRAAGDPALDGLDKASRDLDGLALGYLTKEQLAEVRELVEDWYRRNPSLVAIESIRLSDFSGKAGVRAQELERAVSGMLAPVVGAVMAADRAILLGERGLYYAQQAPYLMRMQSVATIQDLLGEAHAALSDFPLSGKNMVQMERLLALSKEALGWSEKAFTAMYPPVAEFRKLSELLAKNPQLQAGNLVLLERLLSALKEANRMLETKSGLNQENIRGLTSQFQAQIRNFLLALLFMGIILIAFTGLAYVLSRMAVERLASRRERPKPPEQKGRAA